MDVKNKVVLVTGAGSGIGAATAKHFAHYKAKVVVADIKKSKAEETLKIIYENGGEAIALQANVAHYEEMEQLIKQTVLHYGRLDVMVNNAGIGPKNLLKTADHTLDDWDRVIAVNQTGVFYGMKLALFRNLER